MSKVVLDISMSLDGYIRAANPTPEEPLGVGGERLHDWAFGADELSSKVAQEGVEGIGAMISGRTTYDDSLRFWGPDGPTGERRVQLFVVTHEAPETSPENGVYTFVTDGLESAIAQARAVANGKDVTIMGGADLGQKYLNAGLVDEIGLHVVPWLFGSGTPLFANLGIDHTALEVLDVVSTPSAVHLRYVVKK
jgi:dihydrofolate reductase